MEVIMSVAKKFFVLFFLLFVFSVNGFSQSFNMNSYTQISALSFRSTSVGGTGTKYVVLCDIIAGRAATGEIIYYIAHSNEHGNAALAFDMNSDQISQFTKIKSNKDMQLVFFTRTGTNNDNYHFVVDRIIPMKEVIGFSQDELPETVSYDDCSNVVATYIKTGKADQNTVVLDKVNKARNEARLSEAMRSAETERQAELQRQQEAERRETRNAERDRMRLLRSTTIFGGYKPCFGTENVIDLNQNRIAVFGDIEDSYNNFSVSSGNNPVMKTSGINKIVIKSDAETKDLLREIRRYNGLSSDLDSKTCIFFLSRSNASDDYKLDDYILYEDIVPGSSFVNQYNAGALDEWILKNADK
jgi:hypothetical protein